MYIFMYIQLITSLLTYITVDRLSYVFSLIDAFKVFVIIYSKYQVSTFKYSK